MKISTTYCDRCGSKTMERLCTTDKLHLKRIDEETSELLSIDLCAFCQTDLRKWFNQKPNIKQQSTTNPNNNNYEKANIRIRDSV